MTTSPPRTIQLLQDRSAMPFTADIPGSKSYTNRALVLAAMRMGTTEVVGGLDCDDTQVLAKALDAFGGLRVQATAEGFRAERTHEQLEAPETELHMGAAATPARFMLAFAASVKGSTVVTGTERLCERPMDDILVTLRAIGIQCECLGRPGCLPVRVHGSKPTHLSWPIGAAVSSQFTSSLLLFASQQSGAPITLALQGNQASQPYVEMTRSMMAQCGIQTERPQPDRIIVHPSSPTPERIVVEPDASGMSYFLALAAITGTTVDIPGIGKDSTQGDVGLAHALAEMGCTVKLDAETIRITGGPLRGIDIDMATMPDVVLTLAVVASCAATPTRITNIANLRVKECDRIHAAAAELNRLGSEVEEGQDYLVIKPTGHWRPALVRTYDDHRVAMAMSLLGLLHPGVDIEGPTCVAKSFPNYWTEFERFRTHHESDR